MAVASTSDLIDEHVSEAQCSKAIESLLKHSRAHQTKQDEGELLPGVEPHVWLVLAVKKMVPEKKLKPFRIPIAYPLVDPRTSGVCLITKDPQREYKDLIEKNGVKFISRVVGIEKLKGKWKPFEARRLLLRENGLFLADERVVPLLPKLLGKAFFQAKKQPIPVCITRKDLKGELERAISSTYMHQNQGTCTSIKVGTLSQTPAQIIANIRAALPAVVKHVNGGWDNVQAFHIKTNASVALPIWSCKLDGGEGGRWSVTAADTTAQEADDNEGEEEIEEETKKKSKKRTAATSIDAAMLPTKKAKRSPAAPAAEEQAEAVPKVPAVLTTTKTKTKKLPTTAVDDSSAVIEATEEKSIVASTSVPAAAKVKAKKSVKITELSPSASSGKTATVTETKTVTLSPTLSSAPSKSSKGKAKVTIVDTVDAAIAGSEAPKATKSALKKVESVAAAVPASLAPSAAELKAKKAALGGAGDRKKEKALASSRGAKERGSAKKEILGRKK